MSSNKYIYIYIYIYILDTLSILLQNLTLYQLVRILRQLHVYKKEPSKAALGSGAGTGSTPPDSITLRMCVAAQMSLRFGVLGSGPLGLKTPI